MMVFVAGHNLMVVCTSSLVRIVPGSSMGARMLNWVSRSIFCVVPVVKAEIKLCEPIVMSSAYWCSWEDDCWRGWRRWLGVMVATDDEVRAMYLLQYRISDRRDRLLGCWMQISLIQPIWVCLRANSTSTHCTLLFMIVSRAEARRRRAGCGWSEVFGDLSTYVLVLRTGTYPSQLPKPKTKIRDGRWTQNPRTSRENKCVVSIVVILQAIILSYKHVQNSHIEISSRILWRSQAGGELQPLHVCCLFETMTTQAGLQLWSFSPKLSMSDIQMILYTALFSRWHGWNNNQYSLTPLPYILNAIKQTLDTQIFKIAKKKNNTKI